jgi:hypothetical protein
MDNLRPLPHRASKNSQAQFINLPDPDSPSVSGQQQHQVYSDSEHTSDSETEPEQIIIMPIEPPAQAESGNHVIRFPPPYYGSPAKDKLYTVQEFVSKIKALVDMKKIIDLPGVKNVMLSHTSLNAFNFLDRVQVTDYADVNAFLNDFTRNFDTKPSKLALQRKVQDRKFTEIDTIETYANDILDLCLQCEIDDAETQIKHLYLGLPMQTQSILLNLDKTTFHDAKKALQNLGSSVHDALAAESSKLGTASGGQEAYVASLHQKIECLSQKLDSTKSLAALEAKIDAISFKADSHSQSVNANFATPDQHKQQKVTCQFCNKDNHIASECRQLLSRYNAQSQAPAPQWQYQNYGSMPNHPPSQQYGQPPPGPVHTGNNYMQQGWQNGARRGNQGPNQGQSQGGNQNAGRGLCHWCNRSGHRIADCRKRQRDQARPNQGN